MGPQNKNNDGESIEDDIEIMALEKILAEAEEENEKVQVKDVHAKNNNQFRPQIMEDNTFAEAFGYEVDKDLEREIDKQVAKTREELDSSDDEEIRNFLERKYNEYGCDINKKLKQQRQATKESQVDYEVDKFLRQDKSDDNSGATKSLTTHIKNPHNPIKRQSLISDSFKILPAATKANLKESESQVRKSLPVTASSNSSVYTDPVFGLRIINPLVSSTLLKERMNDRKPVAFSAVAFHIQRGDLSQDWVIAGVLVHKNPVQMSKKGQPYSIWRLSDLKGEIKTLSLFLFKGAHKELWKTAQGMCIAILNPTIFEKRADSKDVACLSIDTAQKVMILGQSKDLGNCKAIKRNGEVCNAIVNLNECNTCIFHLKQEFGNMSKRSELQSANAGRGLNELRNKVLGKSEVFYGGQSFTAVPARKSAKLIQKDNSIISSLSEYAVSPFAGSINHKSKTKTMAVTSVPYASRVGPVSRIAGNVEATTKQRLKDLERLKILQAESQNKSQNSETNTTISKTEAAATFSTPSISAVPDKFKNRDFSFASKSPQLSKDNFCIEVNIGDRRAQLAKMKAVEMLKKKPIEKINPNSVRGTRDGKRRAIDELNELFMSNESKKQKLEQEQKEQDRKTRLQRIMDASSSHTNLVDIRELEEQEKYFSKLEKKEALEEKMLSTYKIPCKAIICKICKYTAFSAAERCKEERHPLKTVDAEKRFFQCKDCGNRTVSVFKLPKTSCKNCQSSRWERCAMIRERKVCDGAEGLSLRGDEEMFIGSIAGKANLNLVVADD